MKKSAFILAIILVLSSIVFYSPFKIPYSIESMGQIQPYREWIVTRRDDGLVMVTMQNNEVGSIETYSATQFERGDPIHFRANELLIPGATVSVGDTVGWIASSEIRSQLVQLTGELKTQRALLRMAETGEKEPVIVEARKRVEHAREQLEEQILIVNRTKNLFETKYIPYQDYEVSKKTLELFEINIEIAEAQLQSLQTGAKREEIDMISSGIDALENMIDVVTDRLEDYTLKSPLSGIVLDASFDSILVKIGDISRNVVIIPIPLKMKKHISFQQDVEVKMLGSEDSHRARIVKLGNAVQIINGEQYFIATSLLESNGENILAGTISRCSIICEPVTLSEYLTRTIHTLLNR